MGARIDLTGHRYGHLVVHEFVETLSNGQSLWECLCDCGNKSRAFAGNLRSGHTTSCGCQSSRNKKVTHGLSYTPEYKSWKSMVARCTDTTHNSFEQYGGRGIKVHPQWLASPTTFVADMGQRPEGCTLDREDNDGDYTPENCRWANLATQNNNRRSNVRLTYKGKTLTMAEWSERLGWKPSIIKYRRAAGWSTKRILETPVRKYKHQ